MKRISAIIFAAFILLLAACESIPATEAPAKTTKAAAPNLYNISDSVIYRNNKDAIYDSSLYYDESWTAWVDNVTEADGTLYFTEGAAFNDGISCICDASLKGAAYAVVKTDLNGKDRRVLVSKTTPNGYSDVFPFAGKVFYVDLSMETASVGYVGIDGGDAAALELPARKDDVCTYAKLDTDGDYLIIEADFILGNDTATSRIYRIDSALNIESVDKR